VNHHTASDFTPTLEQVRAARNLLEFMRNNKPLVGIGRTMASYIHDRLRIERQVRFSFPPRQLPGDD